VAASLNRVFLIGNLTRDPELRYIPSGQAVTSFSLAVNRNYVSQQGEKKQETSFIRIVVWGRRGEVCNEYLKKGSPVCVEGRLQSRSWEGQDGSKRSTIEVIADSVQFLPRGTGNRSKGEEDNVNDAQGSESVEANQGLAPDEEVPF